MNGDPIDTLEVVVGLSPAEHRAMELTAELVGVVCMEIIGNGETRSHDISEFVAQVHVIQKSIMGQAAARAHPQMYRLLGEQIPLPVLE